MTTPGRILPAFDPCGYDLPDAVKRFKDALGLAFAGAQDAINGAQTSVGSAVLAMNAALGAVDQFLAVNPDPTTPNSIATLTSSLGMLPPESASDRNAVEEQLGKMFGLNVINGILIPKGATKLGTLKRLFQSLEISESGCRIPDLSRDFIFVTSYNDTVENAAGSSCGRELLSYTVVERKIGENISLSKAAKLSGKPEGEILIRFFWIKTIKRDFATLKRLKAMGIVGSDLTNVLLAPKDVGRVYSAVVDPEVVTSLLTNTDMTEVDVCRLMSRPDIGGIDPAPTAKAVLKTINQVVGANNPSSRPNRTSQIQASDTGISPAGRNGDPITMLLAALNMNRSLRLNPTATGITIDGEALALDDIQDPKCRALASCIFEAIATIQTLAQQGLDLFQKLLSLGAGAASASAGAQFSTCLGSAGIGLDISINLAIGLPFQMQVFLGAFTAAMAAVAAVVLAIKAFLCIPNALVQLLFGGICGFKPFSFDLCPPPPDLSMLLDRLNDLVVLATMFITQLLGMLQIFKIDIAAALSMSLELKFAVTCAAAIVPVAVAMGLMGDLKIEASASVEAGLLGSSASATAGTPASVSESPVASLSTTQAASLTTGATTSKTSTFVEGGAFKIG